MLAASANQVVHLASYADTADAYRHTIDLRAVDHLHLQEHVVSAWLHRPECQQQPSNTAMTLHLSST